MAKSPSTELEGISRIVFREILDGDRKKFIARSNISDTGGGARDIRFRAWDKMEPVLRKMFPLERAEDRRRGKTATQLHVFSGELYWLDKANNVQSKEMILEPPTDARPNEGRITKVHEYGCFSNLPSTKDAGRLLLLLVQRSDQTVWPSFATESSLEKDDWNPEVAKFLLTSLRTKRSTVHAAYGFIDFENHQRYSNA